MPRALTGPQSKAFPPPLPSSAHVHPFFSDAALLCIPPFPLPPPPLSVLPTPPNLPLPPPTPGSLQVPADEVCGCPLVRDVFELTGDFCRLPKRQCNRHYCWEKLRRAEVDLERVRVVGPARGVRMRRGPVERGSRAAAEGLCSPHSGTSWTSCLSRSATCARP